jgi:hypothetical protein
MSAAHKTLLIFQMVRTACAPVQQLRPEAQGNTHGKGQNPGEGGEKNKNWQGHCDS